MTLKITIKLKQKNIKNLKNQTYLNPYLIDSNGSFMGYALKHTLTHPKSRELLELHRP
jgi:hypothetical protein